MSGEEGIGRRAPAGRGRGRARATEPTQPVAAPPGPIAEPEAAAGGAGEVGRRGPAVGRRADVAGGPVTPPDKKPQRGSPEDTGSPSELEKLEELSLISLAQRPGIGTVGRKYRMFTNHFEIGFMNKMLTVNRYHVEITHPRVKLTRDDNRPIFWECLLKHANELGVPEHDHLYAVAFDGVSNCFAVRPFNMPRDNIRRYDVEATVSKCDKPMTVSVLIQGVGPQLVDMKQVVSTGTSSKVLTPIQCIDIILRQFRSNPLLDSAKCFYPFRNSVFLIPGSSSTAPGGLDLQGGREVWRGLFTSAHVADNFKCLVNMDVDHTAFYKCGGGNGNGNGGRYSVLQFLCDVLNEAERRAVFHPSQLNESTSLTDNQKRMVEREIKGLKVCIDYEKPNCTNQNREYRVFGIDKPNDEVKFPTREGVETNVYEYFNKTYGMLKYRKLNTLKVGTKAKPFHLPMERCYLAKNQRVNKKLNENQTATMIRQTCMAPADRKRSIEQMVHLARFEGDPFLNSFGVQLNPNMMQVEGRILPAPTLTYANNAAPPLREGVWRATGNRFHSPASIKGMAAVAFGQAPNGAQPFVGQLLSMCKQCGMNVPSPDQVFFHLEQNSTPQRAEVAFKKVAEMMQQHNLELNLVLVFLLQKGSALYADVKRVAEVQMGIMTQCVTAKTVGKPSPDTLLNIVLKINMKLGGINCALTTREAAGRTLLDVPTLLLGIDVTHPGPIDKRSPSVASIVGSIDTSHMRYCASIKVQKQRRESLVYLADPVTERLMAFFKNTNVKPERIIVYRDGVSEGEFKTVLREELRGIREACLKVDPNYKPKITFIVVQKRHHTRFFPADPMDGCGKHKNVFPGSTVDTEIVFHDDFVFYLCSHAGIQGTSRPTRYHVLHDDNRFSSDDIQMMSYYLCHCFSRCTRAVSIPAPVFYAHLACTRARSHLQQLIGDSMSDTASSASGGGPSTSIPEDELIRAATVQEVIRKEMYFT